MSDRRPQSRLRVCFVGSLPPPTGGAALQAVELAKRLPRFGVDVVFVDISRELPGKTPLERAPCYSRGRGLARIRRSLTNRLPAFACYLGRAWSIRCEVALAWRDCIRCAEMAAVIEQACRGQAPIDVINTNHANERGLAGILVAQRLGLPVLLTVYGGEFTEEDTNKKLAAYCVGAADFIASNSDFTRSLAAATGAATPMRTTYCGVDTEVFRPDIAPGDIREKYGIRPGEKLVLYAGWYIKRKGPDVLLEALRRLRDRGQAQGVKCVMCGPERGMGRLLKEMIAEKGLGDLVNQTYEVPFEDLLRLYAAADVFVFPTRMRTEGFGLVAAEAMACGTPVIASRIAAIPEVVEDGKTGLLFEPGNAEELADKILELLRDDARRAAMGQYAAARMREKFNWDRMAAETAEIYRALDEQSLRCV